MPNGGVWFRQRRKKSRLVAGTGTGTGTGTAGAVGVQEFRVWFRRYLETVAMAAAR